MFLKYFIINLPQIIKNINGALMEPIMALEIVIDEKYNSIVMADINRRRGNLIKTSTRNDTKVSSINPNIPNGK